MTELDRASARPVAKEGLELVEGADGLVIYDEATDRVHHLNQTAAVILGLCDGSQTVEEIATAVGRLFEIDGVPVELTQQCLADLRREDLIA